MAALLSSRDGRRRAREVLRRAHRRLPADGHRGPAARTSTRATSTFRVADEGKIHFGLGAIKGVGNKAVEAIVEARARGRAVPRPRRLLRARLPRGSSARRCVETLIKAGAFDCLGARRSQLWPSCPGPSRPARPAGGPQARPARPVRRLRRAPDPAYGERQRQWQRERQWQRHAHGRRRSNLPDVPELPDAERLAEEKKALGFYMSSHPLTRHAALLQALPHAPGRRPRPACPRRPRSCSAG